MMRTIWIEFTGWRGAAIDRTLFGPVYRLGWVGVGFSKTTLSDWVAAWRAPLKKIFEGDAR